MTRPEPTALSVAAPEPTTGTSYGGLFIALEGGDGAGKSTQLALLRQWLESLGRTVVVTREPGGTPFGRHVRDLVLHGDHVAPRAEALLFAADRAHHVETLVRPALERGDVVLTDRYLDSSVAYQGAGRDLGADEVERPLAVGDAGAAARPHRGPRHRPEAGRERRGDVHDRLESEPDDFHGRVRQALPRPGRRASRSATSSWRPTAAVTTSRRRSASGCEALLDARVVSVWADVVGQERAVETLQRAVTDPGAMTHAWLLTGPPGSGRSVAARAFAAALQCPDGGCGQCRECRTALDGTHADVTVVATEGLSIRVDEARDLVALAAAPAVGGPWRVIIIEDADRLTERAPPTPCSRPSRSRSRAPCGCCARPRSRTSSSPSGPGRGTCGCAHRRSRPWPSCWCAATASTRRWRCTPPAPPRATSASPAGWPATSGPASGAVTSSPWPRRSAAWATPSARRPTSPQIAAEESTRVRDRARRRRAGRLLETLGADAAARTQPPHVRSQVAALEREQKTRATRFARDVVDRALVDLLSVYRDALVLHAGASTSPWSTRTRPTTSSALAGVLGPEQLLQADGRDRRGPRRGSTPTCAAAGPRGDGDLAAAASLTRRAPAGASSASDGEVTAFVGRCSGIPSERTSSRGAAVVVGGFRSAGPEPSTARAAARSRPRAGRGARRLGVQRPRSRRRTAAPSTDAAAEASARTPPSGQAALARYYNQKLRWSACHGFQCATLTVPLDYAKPDRAHLTIGRAAQGRATRAPPRLAAGQPRRPGCLGRRLRRGGGHIVSSRCAPATTSSASTRAGSAQLRPGHCLDDRELDAFLGERPDT